MFSDVRITLVSYFSITLKINMGKHPTRYRCEVKGCTHQKATKVGYTRLQDLKYHKNSCHNSNVIKFECKICHKEFCTRRGMNKHLTRHHNGEGVKIIFKFKCTECCMRFNTKKELDDHLCDFQCPKCEHIFEDLKSFHMHILQSLCFNKKKKERTKKSAKD